MNTSNIDRLIFLLEELRVNPHNLKSSYLYHYSNGRSVVAVQKDYSRLITLLKQIGLIDKSETKKGVVAPTPKLSLIHKNYDYKTRLIIYELYAVFSIHLDSSCEFYDLDNYPDILKFIDNRLVGLDITNNESGMAKHYHIEKCTTSMNGVGGCYGGSKALVA